MDVDSQFSNHGEKCLLRLPSHLITHVTDNLLLKDQRSFYTCCSQLYRHWLPHCKTHNPDTQFLLGAVSLLERSLSNSALYHSCENGGTCLKAYCASDQTMVEVQANETPSLDGTMNSLRSYVTWAASTEGRLPDNTYETMGRCLQQPPRQLLAGLTSGPSITAASITLSTHERADWSILRESAERWYAFLCNSKGLLIFYLEHPCLLGQAPQVMLADREQLRVTHWDSELSWTIDGINQSGPPEMGFEQMPKRVSRVVAQFYNPTATWTENTPVVPHFQHIESVQYWRLGIAEGNFAFKNNDMTAFFARDLYHNTPEPVFIGEQGYLLDNGHVRQPTPWAFTDSD
ncbi:TPA: hypothetical protein ACH3X2_007390 [Trebouxia sp. C0005]